MIADASDFFDAMIAVGVEVARTHTGGLQVRGPAVAVRLLALQIRPRRAELLSHIAALERSAYTRWGVRRVEAPLAPVPDEHPLEPVAPEPSPAQRHRTQLSKSLRALADGETPSHPDDLFALQAMADAAEIGEHDHHDITALCSRATVDQADIREDAHRLAHELSNT
jgi:hypothetical protein